MGYCISWDGWVVIFESLYSRASLRLMQQSSSGYLWAFCVILASNQDDNMISTEQGLVRTLVDKLWLTTRT